MYAIMNAKTKKFVFGTDRRQAYKSKNTHGYNNLTYKQRTSFNQAITYEYLDYAVHDRKSRMMSKDYKIVKIKMIAEEILTENDIEKILEQED